MEAWKKKIFDSAYKGMIKTAENYNNICDDLEIPEMKLERLKFIFETRNAINKQKGEQDKDNTMEVR